MTGKKTKFLNTTKLTRTKVVFTENILLIKFVYAALLLSLINITAVMVMQKHLPPQVPLFYGYTEGEQQLTTPTGLLIPGVFSLTLITINTTIAFILKNDFLKKTLSITSFTISFLALITVIKIIFLVGFF